MQRHAQIARKPEGPYETEDRDRRGGVTNRELERFLDFVEQFESEAELSLTIKKGYSEIRILAALMRDHLAGKLTTSSSLIGASGLSYGTAFRALRDMENRGLLQRRSRTKTGKSFSLHPTAKMIREWQEFARRGQALLGTTLAIEKGSLAGPSDYFFGSSYAARNVMPPPEMLAAKLPMSDGLRLLVHADPTFMAMHSLKRQFEFMFGTAIKSRALSIDRLRAEILDNAARGKGRSRYDIIACDLPWFGEMADAGHFLAIDELAARTKFKDMDFHPVALSSVRHRGKRYGIPVQTTPELLVCRRDLLADHSLQAPGTVDELLEIVKEVHDPLRDVAGIAWNAARGTALGNSFLFISGAFGRPVLNLRPSKFGFDGEHVDGECCRPMFDTDEVRAAAEYLLELLDFSPRGILSMSWYEGARCYADGKAALAYSATLLAPLFELNGNSPAFGNTEYHPHPCGPAGKPIAPLGGYALAIPSNIAPERIDPVWSAVAELTSAQSIKLYIENGSLVSPRFSVSTDPEVLGMSPLISIVDEMARTGVVQMWPRPPVPEIASVIKIAGEEIHDMLRRSKTPTEALANAQNRVDALMRANGRY